MYQSGNPESVQCTDVNSTQRPVQVSNSLPDLSSGPKLAPYAEVCRELIICNTIKFYLMCTPLYTNKYLQSLSVYTNLFPITNWKTEVKFIPESVKNQSHVPCLWWKQKLLVQIPKQETCDTSALHGLQSILWRRGLCYGSVE